MHDEDAFWAGKFGAWRPILTEDGSACGLVANHPDKNNHRRYRYAPPTAFRVNCASIAREHRGTRCFPIEQIALSTA